MKLQFEVAGQRLTLAKRRQLVSDTINFLDASFTFSAEWAGLVKTAHFGQGAAVYDLILENDEITPAMHLDLGAGAWSVWVHGDKTAGGDVTQRITTTTVSFSVSASGVLSGEPMPVTPASLGEQILVTARHAESVAQSVRNDADAGVFDGAPGPQGPAGSDADVTAENIETALQTATETQQAAIRTDIGAVGTQDIATAGSLGLVKAPKTYGIGVNAQGVLYVDGATTYQIQQKASSVVAISPNNLDYAVRAGLLANSQITLADYDAICGTIGAERKHGDYELIETITLTEDTDSIERTQEPGGAAYDFAALYVRCAAPAAAANTSVMLDVFAGTTKVGMGQMVSLNTGGTRYGSVEVYKRHGLWMVEFMNATGLWNNPLRNGAFFGSDVISAELYPAIDKLKLRRNSIDAPIPAGTIINIYGVRS